MGKDSTGARSPQRKLAPNIVGSEERKPTSLRGIANSAWSETATSCAEASATEEPDAGKLHVRVCAGGVG